MQKLENKKWTSPKIVVCTIAEKDIITASFNEALVSDTEDDAKAFRKYWYDN